MMVDRVALLTRVECAEEQLKRWSQEKLDELQTAQEGVMTADKGLEECSSVMESYS